VRYCWVFREELQAYLDVESDSKVEVALGFGFDVCGGEHFRRVRDTNENLGILPEYRTEGNT
jgi:hypothetical protein